MRSRSTPWLPRRRHFRRITGTTIAVYCMSGNMSATAVQDLADLGYTDVVELDGGMMAWMADGRELLPPAALIRPPPFSADTDRVRQMPRSEEGRQETRVRAEVTAASRCGRHIDLATLAGLGPYFTARRVIPGRATGVRCATCTTTPTRSPASLVARGGARIGSTEYRVAASTLSLGYAARLWSLTLGGIVRAGILPDADRLLWRDTDGRNDASGRAVGWGGTGLVDVAREMVLDRHLAPLVAAIRTVEPMSDRLLWGNAASALIGPPACSTVASDTRQCASAETMLRDSRLIDTVDRQGDGYRRRSCCLFYRTPVSGYCGDCALIPPHAPEPGEGSDPRK